MKIKKFGQRIDVLESTMITMSIFFRTSRVRKIMSMTVNFFSTLIKINMNSLSIFFYPVLKNIFRLKLNEFFLPYDTFKALKTQCFTDVLRFFEPKLNATL